MHFVFSHADEMDGSCKRKQIPFVFLPKWLFLAVVVVVVLILFDPPKKENQIRQEKSAHHVTFFTIKIAIF